MTLSPIPVDKFTVSPHHLWDKQSLILTAGDFAAGRFNAMTVGWGSFGTMWNRPIAMVVVRPQRYTYEFIEKYDTFTLCAFPPEHQTAVDLIGTTSGRYINKIAEAGLTPVAASLVAAPIFAEAELAVECRKIFRTVFEPSQFVDPAIDQNYLKGDYHRVYFGEILAVAGIESFARR
jgi:flavin reductase (DIM6/NTAB) family NADH-FMN oxidoreductase RutF